MESTNVNTNTSNIPTTTTPTTNTTGVPTTPNTITPITPTAPNIPNINTTKANTPICKHFQQGKCKYGEHCWKIHQKVPLLKDVTIVDGEMVYICPQGTQCHNKDSWMINQCKYYHPSTT